MAAPTHGATEEEVDRVIAGMALSKMVRALPSFDPVDPRREEVLDLTALRDEICRLVLRLLQTKKLKEVAGRSRGSESPFLECATRAKDENRALRSHIFDDVKEGSTWGKRHMRTWSKSAFAASWGTPARPTLITPFSNLMLNQKWSGHLLSWLKGVQATMMLYTIDSPVWQVEGHYTGGQIVSVAIREWEADEGQSVKRLSVYCALEQWSQLSISLITRSLSRRPRLVFIKRSLARLGTTRANLLRLMLIGMALRKLMRRVWPTNRSTFPSLGARP